MSDPWFYEDVAFNHTHAAEAIEALRTLKVQVNALAEVREAAVTEPRQTWQGRFRDDFDREFPVTQDALGARYEQINEMIAAINTAADQAEEDQAARVQMRADYEAEQAEAEAEDEDGEG